MYVHTHTRRQISYIDPIADMPMYMIYLRCQDWTYINTISFIRCACDRVELLGSNLMCPVNWQEDIMEWKFLYMAEQVGTHCTLPHIFPHFITKNN